MSLSSSRTFQPLPNCFLLASFRCPVCSHANDYDFRFCQRCGYKMRMSSTCGPEEKLTINLVEIDDRLRQLENYDQVTNLRRELCSFLAGLPGQVSLVTVTPRDLCRLLVYKDKDGKTQVHRNSCGYLGQRESL